MFNQTGNRLYGAAGFIGGLEPGNQYEYLFQIDFGLFHNHASIPYLKLKINKLAYWP